jgi:hypothetical protein
MSKKPDAEMEYEQAQEIMRRSLLQSGMTWTDARQAIKSNPKLQATLKELRKEAKDE